MASTKPTLKIVKLRKPDCWIYDHPNGSVIVYPAERKRLDLKTANFLLDMAKKRLLE